MSKKVNFQKSDFKIHLIYFFPIRLWLSSMYLNNLEK